MCSPEALKARLAHEIASGVRNEDIIERSLSRLDNYNNMNTYKIVRQELEIAEDVTVFMFLGRLNKDKGVLDLVDAFVSLKNKYEKICLL